MSDNLQSSQAAPIDEYRILWTAQKKQKLKKWHDGFLRFHKFNKRLLVYDDARHLVADMYLRGQDTIDEGDDLEFENHLVTVEDFKGTIVQDLTPIFTSAVKRKQQIQTGNMFLNPETPNQTNRHGLMGTSNQSATPTLRQGPIAAAAARFPPQTPVQRRPTNTNISLQQSIRKNNKIKHPHPYEGRPQARAQALLARAEPLLGSHIISTTPPAQQARQPGPQRSDGTTAYSNTHRPPFNVLDGPPSPGGRLNQPPKQQALSAPQDRRASSGSKNAPIYKAPSHVNRRPPNSDGFSDAVRPLNLHLSYSKPNNIFSDPAPISRGTPDVPADMDSDDEIFGSPPDFNNVTPPSAQQPVIGPSRAPKQSLNTFRNPDNDPRPPPKRVPENPTSKNTVAASNTNTGESSKLRTPRPLCNHEPSTAPRKSLAAETITITSPGNKSEKNGTLEPLVSAGTILLGNAVTRKRSKLLCQRLSLVEPPAKAWEPPPKRARREPPPLPVTVEETVVKVAAAAGTSNDAPIPPPPTVKKGLGAFKFQPPKMVRDDKGKGIEDHSQYRVKEIPDTIEYQREHDIGHGARRRSACLIGDRQD